MTYLFYKLSHTYIRGKEWWKSKKQTWNFGPRNFGKHMLVLNCFHRIFLTLSGFKKRNDSTYFETNALHRCATLSHSTFNILWSKLKTPKKSNALFWNNNAWEWLRGPAIMTSITTSHGRSQLVGGFTPFGKDARQIGSFQPLSDDKMTKILRNHHLPVLPKRVSQSTIP